MITVFLDRCNLGKNRCHDCKDSFQGVRELTAIESSILKERTAAESGLLLYPKNAVLCRLGDSEFDDGLGRNLDLLLRLGIEARVPSSSA